MKSNIRNIALCFAILSILFLGQINIGFLSLRNVFAAIFLFIVVLKQKKFSVFLMRKLAIQSLGEIPSVKEESIAWIINDVLSLYPRYNKRYQLDKLLKEYNLSIYFTIKQILSSCGIRQGLRCLIKYYYPVALIK